MRTGGESKACTAPSNKTTLFLEAIKCREHYLLIYPNTPNGRMEAKKSVRMWFTDCELDFDRQDADQVLGAINRGRLGRTPGYPTLGRNLGGNGGLP